MKEAPGAMAPDVVALDAVTLDAVTLDAVALDAVTLDAKEPYVAEAWDAVSNVRSVSASMTDYVAV